MAGPEGNTFQEDFIAQNEPTIRVIVGAVMKLTEQYAPFTFYKESMPFKLRVVGPDQISDPNVIASAIDIAAFGIQSLQAAVLMADAAKRIAQGETEVEVMLRIKEPSALPVFDEMFYRRLEFSGDDPRRPPVIVMTHAHLAGSAVYGNADEAVVHLAGNDTRNSFSITTLGDQIHSVHHSVTPTSDRLHEILSKDDRNMMLYIRCGLFEDEAELDANIRMILLGYIGTSNEQEVSQLLGEARIQALAFRDVIRLERDTGVGIPSPEDLEIISTLLTLLLTR